MWTRYVFCLFATVILSNAAAAREIWISKEALAVLPTTGEAWDRLNSVAYSDFGVAKGGHDDTHDVNTLGQALVAARLGDNALRERVIANLLSAIGTDSSRCTGKYCDVLSISRNLAAYVIAADIIDFPERDPDREAPFRAWVADMLSRDHKPNGCAVGHCSIPEKFYRRPNNHGTMAGASFAAASIYLGQEANIPNIANVFRGFLGDRNAYVDFVYGGPTDQLDWQSDPGRPVGINPPGATIQGHNVSGVIPDDQRRSGQFRWPPPKENYFYECLQGAMVLAVILSRWGYDSFDWSDAALLRSYVWLYTEAGFPAEGDDTFQLPLVDYYYGTQYWNGDRVSVGKNMGWTDWTHAGGMFVAKSPVAPTLIW